MEDAGGKSDGRSRASTITLTEAGISDQDATSAWPVGAAQLDANRRWRFMQARR
jgi:hypothetical protein